MIYQTQGAEAYLASWYTPYGSEDTANQIMTAAWSTELYDQLEPTLGARLKMAPAGEVMYRLIERAVAGSVVGMTGSGDVYRDGIHYTAIGTACVVLTICAVDLGFIPSHGYTAESLGITQAVLDDILEVIAEVAAADARMGVQL